MIIFGIFIVFGVFVFGGFIPSPKDPTKEATKGNLIVWGTVPALVMNSVILANVTSQYQELSVKYIEKRRAEFETDLIEALAAGTGPDMVILPNDLFVRFITQIEPFDPLAYSERNFRDTFIDNGLTFVQDQSVYALPIWTDPLVMYWNRDMLSSANVARAPMYWDEFYLLAPALTKRTEGNEIQKSAVSFGEFRNVTNAKEILSTIILQTGNPLVRYSGGVFTVTASGDGTAIPSIDTSLRFFTDFADPLKPVYSWNRSLAESKDAFLAGDLAFYFGFASELSDIRIKNPNLNFDVAAMPQIRDNSYKMTYGKIGGAAVMKVSTQKPQAFLVAQLFSSAEASKAITESLSTPPARRDLISAPQKDPFLQMFYAGALISRSWLDFQPDKTYDILRTATESILSGKNTISQATSMVQAEFSLLAKMKSQ